MYLKPCTSQTCVSSAVRLEMRQVTDCEPSKVEPVGHIPHISKHVPQTLGMFVLSLVFDHSFPIEDYNQPG
jgi:hypothetical protein